MDWLVALIIIFIVLVAAGAVLTARRRATVAYPYTKNQFLFSPAEHSFLGVLEQAVGPEYRVFGKVRVADLIDIKKGLNRTDRQKALNRVLSKHFDFVLCAKDDLSVVCVIELDDQSHQTVRRRDRDAFLVGLCEAVSLPLIQIPARHAYSVPEVRATVMGALSVPPQATAGTAAEPPPDAVPGEAQESPSVTATEADELTAEVNQPALSPKPHVPSCPKCSSPMVRRQAKSGANAGETFWGCSRFPKCHGIIPIGT
jgi:Protein of unknown function (DUF2726)/Topoisomerase DNA binding C4 zinc finger